MLTLFILLHTADPWLEQQHKAICQAFKCQVWHGDVQYALPAVQLLQELQSGKKKKILWWFVRIIHYYSLQSTCQ